MIVIRIVYLIILIGLAACGQYKEDTTGDRKIDQRAKALNDSAVVLAQFYQKEDLVKAIRLLDQATQIDNNYFLAYWNKFSYHTRLKQYDKALIAAKNLTRLRPISPELHGSAGMLYAVTGDSVVAERYLQKASVLYDQVLDTMQSGDLNYNAIIMSKGINLIMIGKQEEGNILLRQLYQDQTDTTFKDLIEEYMDKNRHEIIEAFKSK